MDTTIGIIMWYFIFGIIVYKVKKPGVKSGILMGIAIFSGLSSLTTYSFSDDPDFEEPIWLAVFFIVNVVTCISSVIIRKKTRIKYQLDVPKYNDSSRQNSQQFYSQQGVGFQQQYQPQQTQQPFQQYQQPQPFQQQFQQQYQQPQSFQQQYQQSYQQQQPFQQHYQQPQPTPVDTSQYDDTVDFKNVIIKQAICEGKGILEDFEITIRDPSGRSFSFKCMDGAIVSARSGAMEYKRYV